MPRLELGGARPGRQPARAERLRDGVDLLLGDRRAAGTRGTQFAWTRAPASAVTKRMRSAAASARASASSRLVAGREHGAGAVGAPPERREDDSRARGRSGRARRPRSSGTSTELEHARRRDEEPRHGPADRAARGRARRAAAPSAASSASPFRSTPDRRLDELGVVAAAEPGGDLDHLRPRRRRCGAACTTGRSSIPSATARAAASDTSRRRHLGSARRARARRRRPAGRR